MKSILVGAITALGVVALSTAASAITFDFTSPGTTDSTSTVFVEDGLTLTVTAGTFDSTSNGTTIGSNRNVRQGADGLGANFAQDGVQVDGANGSDVLVFTFSETVLLDSISFANVDFNDTFAFGSVASTTFTRFVDFQDIDSPNLASLFLSLSQRTGDAFGIGAIKFLDNFTVTGLDVSRVAAVPLPPALLMLGSALLGFGFIGSRRRRKVAA